MTNPASSGETSATGRRGYGLGFWCCVVPILLGLYVGAYLALVNKVMRTGAVATVGSKPGITYYAQYARNPSVNRWLVSTFMPLHLIDRRFRRAYWPAPKNAH